jgi:multimeric flavodoxin WrbA
LSEKLYQFACSINADSISINIQQREALKANSDDALDADGIILMTPENLGYMSVYI